MTQAPLARPPGRPLPRFGRRRGPAPRREPGLTLPRPALLPARWSRPPRAGSLAPLVLASLLLHALLLLPLVLDLQPRDRPSEALPPPSFDIVFEGGGPQRNEADAPEGQEVPPAPAIPPAPPPAISGAAPPQPPVAAAPPPPAPLPPVPSPPIPPPPIPQPPVAQAPPPPPLAQPPVPAPPPRQLAEAPRPVSPPPTPPRPDAPPTAEAFPELPMAEQLLAPPTELRLPDRFALPLPPPPTPQPPPRPQPQRPPPQQQARPVQPRPDLPRPDLPRPDLPGVWAPDGVRLGPQAAAPQPPTGRPQGRGLDTRVDPRFAEGRPSADPSVRVTGAQVGADWRAAFRRWLDQNIRYPERAIQLGEDGTVRVRVVANPDGTVRSVQLVGPSTSPSLNFGTSFPFQGARLPAFPPPADPNGVTIDLTVNYILVRR